jgi:hypothetical protein
MNNESIIAIILSGLCSVIVWLAYKLQKTAGRTISDLNKKVNDLADQAVIDNAKEIKDEKQEARNEVRNLDDSNLAAAIGDAPDSNNRISPKVTGNPNRSPF